MFPGNVEWVALEQRKDLLRELEQLRLINTLPRRQSISRRVAQKAVSWIAGNMVIWGLKLQGSQGRAIVLHHRCGGHEPVPPVER